MRTTAKSTEHARLPGPAIFLACITIALTLIDAFMNLVAPRLFHVARTQLWPFGLVDDPFRDFYLYKPRYAFFHSPQFFTFDGWSFMYPAPLAVVSRLFYYPEHSTSIFLSTMVAGFLFGTMLFGDALIRRGVKRGTVVLYLVLALASTNAFVFDFQQANLEFVIWAFMSCGLWAYLHGRGYTAAACFGIAASMKIYPLVFLGLFLSRRQYRQIAWTLLAAFLSTVVSLWLVCPDLKASYRGVQYGLNLFRRGYMLGRMGLDGDHSLFAAIKRTLDICHRLLNRHGLTADELFPVVLQIYMPVVALAGVGLYFLWIRKLPVVNQILCFTVVTILLPPVSFDYTLIHLYALVALLILVALETDGRAIPGMYGAFGCLAILLTSQAEFVYKGQTVSGLIKCATLLALLGIGLRYRFPSSFDRRVIQAAPVTGEGIG
jgi:hypothetical protein